MKAQWLIILTVGLTSAIGTAGREDKSDEEKFTGTWRMVALEGGGAKVPDDQIKEFRYIYTKNSYTVKLGDKTVGEGTYRLDPSVTPKRIDLTSKQKTYLGIYELDGDTLKTCTSLPDAKERPTEFGTKRGSAQSLMVLKRE